MDTALIIDDNKETADSLKQMLSLLVIDAEVAYSSRAGISILQERTPGLVLLDLNMPGVDGFEVMAYLQRDPRLENVPVIIVTSDDQPETIQKAKDAGAKGMLLKPASMEAIEKAIKGAGLLGDKG
jgi:CheY-like chemotaxis protein